MMFTTPNSSEIEVAGLERERITELQQLQSEALSLLEQAKTDVTEAKRGAVLGRREDTNRLAPDSCPRLGSTRA